MAHKTHDKQVKPLITDEPDNRLDHLACRRERARGIVDRKRDDSVAVLIANINESPGRIEIEVTGRLAPRRHPADGGKQARVPVHGEDTDAVVAAVRAVYERPEGATTISAPVSSPVKSVGVDASTWSGSSTPTPLGMRCPRATRRQGRTSQADGPFQKHCSREAP